MTAERTLRYGLELDVRNFIAGTRSAEIAIRNMKDRLEGIHTEMVHSDERMMNLQEQLRRIDLQRSGKYDEVLVSAQEARISRLIENERRYGARLIAQQERTERKLSELIEREEARRTRIRQQERQRALQGTFQGITRAATQGTGIPLPFIGGGVAGIAGAVAGAGVVLTLKKALSDVVDRARAIRELQQIIGGTTEEVSRFIAVGEQFGVTEDKMADAARNLASAIVQHPEQLKALGIETKNTDGSSRDLIDVMEQARRVLGNAKGDYNTLRIAQELFGRSVGDMIPWIRASNEQIEAAAQKAAAAGLVMSREAVEGALKYKASMDLLGRSLDGIVRQIGTALIPMLLKAAEAAMAAGDMVGGFLTSKSWAGSDLPVVGGLGNWIKNIWDTALGNSTEATRQIATQVDTAARLREAFNKLMASGAFEGGGGAKDLGGMDISSLSAGHQAAMDAIRDQIDGIRDRAKAREEEIRDSLRGWEREQKAALDAIEAASSALEKQHEREIRAIEDESRARDKAFHDREESRRGLLDSLRDELRILQETLQTERMQADLEEARKDLAKEQRVQVFRTPGMSALDYYKAVADQEKRVGEARKRLADAQQKIEVETKKRAIEERIRLIEKEADKDRQAHDAWKRDADERIRKIRDQMKVEKDQSDARIKAIQAELDKRREQAEDAIRQLQRETETLVSELEKRLKAHQAAAAAAAAAYPDLRREVRYTVVVEGGVGPGSAGRGTGGGRRDEDETASTRISRSDLQVFAQIGLGRRLGTTPDPAFGGLSEFEAHYRARETQLPDRILADYRVGRAQELLARSGKKLTEFAAGGSIMLGRSTLLVDEASMQPFARAAARAPEIASFGGEGRGAGALTLNMPIHISAQTAGAARRAAHEQVDRAFQDLDEALAGELSRG